MRSATPPAEASLVRMPAWLDDDPRPLDWNGPVDRPFTRFPGSALGRPIADHFERMARLHRDRVAIRQGETALTYGELWESVGGLAETLAAGSHAGDPIGIRLPASPMFALAMLACLAAGRPFVAVDTGHPGDWLDDALKDARPTLIITGEGGPASVEPCVKSIRVMYLTALPKPAREGWRPARLGPDEPACVLFTSGSTGRPKGIVNTQRNLLQRVAQAINAAHINADDRLLTLASPCTIVGVRDILTALLAGASIQLLDPQRTGVHEILKVIRAEAVTILFAFPALLRSIVTAGPAPADATLRLVRVGGDTTLWSDIDSLRSWLAPGARIQSIYAATEAPMLQWFVDDACRTEDACVPIGYPLPGNRLAVLDEDGGVTCPGEVGELVVSSPYVSLGRWTDGRCVDECVEVRNGHAGRVFRTGDLVRQRSDGLLERMGRKDRQVKIHGVRVHLEGVEAFLRKHPGVRDAAALARTTSVLGATTLVAYVSPHEAAPARMITELRALMRSAPAPMRPTHFYVADRIPRLPSSKLDVQALRVLDEANVQKDRATVADQAQLASTAGDRIEAAVARAWREVLLAPVRGPHDDFFDAGGDSLKAIALAMELERALDLELSPTLIYEAPSFSGLCEMLRECREPCDAPLMLLKPGAGAPPVFMIHGVGGNVVDILPTARRMNCAGAVIGIRARGLARGETPHSSVEAMAADYLSAIRAHQPSGPYRLCGYSFGGLVAFEIARRLSESGSEVGFVGLFDTLMSPVRWPLKAWLSIIGRRIARWPGNLRATLAGRRASIPRDDASLPGFSASLPSRVLKVAASALIASARYRPGFYPGQLTLFTPVGREPGLPPLEAIWRKHARNLSIVETRGDHATMLSASNAESTAAALTRCLSAATHRD